MCLPFLGLFGDYLFVPKLKVACTIAACQIGFNFEPLYIYENVKYTALNAINLFSFKFSLASCTSILKS